MALDKIYSNTSPNISDSKITLSLLTYKICEMDHSTIVITSRLSQDQMQIFVSPEVIFQGCLSDFILCFLKSTDEAVSENVYIGYNILYYGIYFY